MPARRGPSAAELLPRALRGAGRGAWSGSATISRKHVHCAADPRLQQLGMYLNGLALAFLPQPGGHLCDPSVRVGGGGAPRAPTNGTGPSSPSWPRETAGARGLDLSSSILGVLVRLLRQQTSPGGVCCRNFYKPGCKLGMRPELGTPRGWLLLIARSRGLDLRRGSRCRREGGGGASRRPSPATERLGPSSSRRRSATGSASCRRRRPAWARPGRDLAPRDRPPARRCRSAQ